MAVKPRIKKKRGSKSAAELRRNAARNALYMMHRHYLEQARKINHLACSYAMPILSSEKIPELEDDYAAMVATFRKPAAKWWREYLLTLFANTEHLCHSDDEAHIFKRMMDKLIEDCSA